MADVIVIGSGVIGATTALYLAREDFAVTVVDELPGSGQGTSFANGGIVTPSTAMPWCSPAVPGLLFKSIARTNGPFLLRPSAMLGILGWGTRFIANCRASKYRTSAEQLTRFAHHSLREMEDLLARLSVDFGLNRGGLLEIFRGADGVRARDRYAGFLDSLGINVQRLESDDCVRVEPSLGPIAESIRAGLFLPEDAWGDAKLFSCAMEQAGRDLGVDFRFDRVVSGIETEGGRVAGVSTSRGPIKSRKVVVCAGSSTRRLVSKLGVSVPIEPVKGYSISLRRDEVEVWPRLPIVDDVVHIGVTPLNEVLRVGGMVEFDRYNFTARPDRIEILKRALRSLFPKIDIPNNCSPWCGLRPMSADGLPIIDECGVLGLYINSGHGGFGWTLACASARLISDIVVGRMQPHSSAFRINRRYW